jgi:hydroxypyruvate reductase
VLGAREALALFLSDVPGDDPAVIGSGLLAAVPGDQVERRIVGSVGHALRAVAAAATAAVPRVEVSAERLVGEAALQGEKIARWLQAAAPGLYLWGGETTVTLPAQPGRGGRNQHLALAAARQLAGDARCLLLAGGTDGVDGQSSDAGALVDGGTWQRAQDGGCDAHAALAGADSGTALEAAGDLVHTGPTGTNVGDIVMGLKLS